MLLSLVNTQLVVGSLTRYVGELSIKRFNTKFQLFVSVIEAKRKRTRWPRPIRVRNQLASAKVVIYPQETVLLDPILYNWKQLSQVLRVESAEELLLHIIHAPLTVPVAMLDEWERASSSWLQLRQILDSFVRNEAILSKNNGYGRLLKKHLKTSGM